MTLKVNDQNHMIFFPISKKIKISFSISNSTKMSRTFRKQKMYNAKIINIRMCNYKCKNKLMKCNKKYIRKQKDIKKNTKNFQRKRKIKVN